MKNGNKASRPEIDTPEIVQTRKDVSQHSPGATQKQLSTEPKLPQKIGKKWLVPSSIGIIAIALGLAGYFVYQNLQLGGGQPNLDQPTPTPTPSVPSPTPDPTENRESYFNSTHNVSFNHPSTWTLTENKGQTEQGVTYNTQVELVKDDAKITMFFNMDGIGGLPQEYEGNIFSLDGNNLYQYKKVNSYNNTKIVGISNSSKTLGVFVLDNVTYSITLEYPLSLDEKKETELLNEFDQILSTFKLTDQSSPALSWETYSNISAGFSIRHPAGWRKVETENSVGFGPQEIGEDVLWGVSVYDKTRMTATQIKDDVGKQFIDREQTEETISFDGLTATKVVTTTNQLEDWYSVIIIVDSEDMLYAISNGAQTDTALNETLTERTGKDYNISFEEFYTSFNPLVIWTCCKAAVNETFSNREHKTGVKTLVSLERLLC